MCDNSTSMETEGNFCSRLYAGWCGKEFFAEILGTFLMMASLSPHIPLPLVHDVPFFLSSSL